MSGEEVNPVDLLRQRRQQQSETNAAMDQMDVDNPLGGGGNGNSLAAVQTLNLTPSTNQDPVRAHPLVASLIPSADHSFFSTEIGERWCAKWHASRRRHRRHRSEAKIQRAGHGWCRRARRDPGIDCGDSWNFVRFSGTAGSSDCRTRITVTDASRGARFSAIGAPAADFPAIDAAAAAAACL